MKRYGIIVAIPQEYDVVDAIFGKPDISSDLPGYDNRVYKYKGYDLGDKTVIFVLSGYGEINAAGATQYAIDILKVDCIINYGVVGGLHNTISLKELGIVEKVVHYGFDLSGGGKYPVGMYPNEGMYLTPNDSALSFWATYRAGSDPAIWTCASADKFVHGGEPKQRLHEQFNADICDMECASVLKICNRNNIPVTIIKAVSDGVDEGDEAFNKNVKDAAETCVKFLKKALELEIN